MLSKVFSSSLCGLFKSQPTILSTSFTFCSTSSTRQESNPLRNKILNISSFDEFNNFFKEKKQQFDPSCYSVASRTLAKILIESRMILNFQHREAIKNFLNHLQKVDIEALNLQQFSQLLYLLRIIKLDPNNSTTFVNSYVRFIIDRAESKIKQLEVESSLSRLSYFYQEYSSLGSKHANAIARKINSILQSNNSQVEFQHLAINEMNLILKGMKCKSQLSNEELNLLRNIIKTVIEKHFDKLSFLELAQISVGISEVMANNPGQVTSAQNADLIHKKVLENIDEMDEKSIMYILNAKRTNNRTYNQIYKIIFQKILDEIQPNGQSSFNELFTLRLFNGISDKVRLSSATPQNQEKFFAFLRLTITKTPRFIHSFVENYVQKGFFNYKQLVRLQQILESLTDFHLKLSLIYQLAKRRINVEKMLSIEKLQQIELKDRNLIMMTYIVDTLAETDGPNKQKYVEILSRLKTKFFDLYKVEDDTFNRVIYTLDNQLLDSFYRLFRKQLQSQLPNPFQSEQPERYRNIWLKIHTYCCTESYFAKRLANQIKQKITGKDLQYLFRTINSSGYQNKESLSNILLLTTKRFDLIFADENLRTLLGRMLSFQLNSIFQQNSNETIKNRFWHILNETIEKTEPQKFIETFSSVISNILKLNIYDFKFSTQYQSILVKLLQRSEALKGRYILNDLLNECLRLNLIRRQDLESLGSKIKENANQNQKLLLKMIESNQFALEGVELNKNNLYMFMFNLSPQTLQFVGKNQDKIINLIEQMRTRQLWKCISHYRLGSKRHQTTVFDALFKNLNKSTLMFDEFSPIFVGEILKRNNFDKYYTKIDNVKVFFKNALEFFVQKRNIHKIPLEDHIELIKYANDFKIRNDDYLHAVFEKYSSDVNIWKRELYLVAGNLGLELNNKELEKLIELNLFTGFTSSFSKSFNIFLLFQNKLENPGTHLRTIINKYNELKSNQKVPIYALYHEYLKKKYPQETKDFEPNYIEKADFCRTIESLNSRSLSLLRQSIEEITNQKFTENVIINNYYYTFRNLALVFPYQSKYFGENLLIKRIFTALTGIEKVCIINRRQSSAKSAVKYLTQSFNGLLTLAEEEQVIKKIQQKIQENKQAQEEAQVEEESQTKVKNEKPTN